MNSHSLPDLTDPKLLLAARQVVWWRPPQKTLQNERLFLNQVMCHGTPDVVVTVRRHYDDDRLRDALREALPGIFDRRSWAYWHLMLDMGPPPPLPIRKVPGVDPKEMPTSVWPEDFQSRSEPRGRP